MKKIIKNTAALSILLFSVSLTAQVGMGLKSIQADETEAPRHRGQPSQSKPLEFGIFYMPTFVTMQLRTTAGGTVQGDVSTAHAFGLMLGYNIGRILGLQTEVSYMPIKQKYLDGGVQREFKVQYVNVPLLLSLNSGKSRRINLNVVGGPQMGIHVGSSTEPITNDASLRAEPGAKGVDIGIAYGAGLQFAISPDRNLRLDLAWRGLSAVTDLSPSKDKVEPGTYNVLVRGTRKYNAIYIGFTWLF